MIQFRRGSSKSWLGFKKPLAAGQPGYDKTENKLKIGDGTTSWEKLDYLVGDLDVKQLIQAEKEANDKTIFTYGNKAPSPSTKGVVYLQQYEGSVEADYVIETGRDINYFFRKWNSGFIECWGKGDVPDRAKKMLKSTIFNVKNSEYFEIKGFWK